MNKERLNGLTDAIIAIVATIMVLEIHAPDSYKFESMKDQIPAILAYLVSFTLIILSWYSYHLMFEQAKRVDLRVFLANAAWMLVLSGIPFATSWVGKFPTHWEPELTYLVMTLIWVLMYSVTAWTLNRANPERTTTVNEEPRINLYIRFGILIVSFLILPIWPPIGLLGTLVLMAVTMVMNLKYEPAVPKNSSD